MSRVLQMPPPPPLLLTKRVTAFLRANLSPHVHSAMLTTPSGSLLAHASNLPASALRRQAAVAASLWALQGPAGTAPTSPGPATATIPPGGAVRSRKSGKHSAPVVTVQLENGMVFVIRRLRCGMLFICMGGAESAAAGRHTPTPPTPHITRLSRSPAPMATEVAPPQIQAPDAATTTATAHTGPSQNNNHPLPLLRASTPPPQLPPPPSPSLLTTPTTTPQPPHSPPSLLAPGPTVPAAATVTSLPGSPCPSESASILSGHTTGAASTASSATVSAGGSGSVSLMRRQVEELARWLDDRLAGLCVPEEGIGIGLGFGLGTGGGSGSGIGMGTQSGEGASMSASASTSVRGGPVGG